MGFGYRGLIPGKNAHRKGVVIQAGPTGVLIKADEITTTLPDPAARPGASPQTTGAAVFTRPGASEFPLQEKIENRAQVSTTEPMATTLLRARVDSRLAAEARQVLDSIGLDTTTAVNMLFAQVVAHRGMPFPVQQAGYTYMEKEYGLSRTEADAAAAGIRAETRRERRAGKLREL